MIKKLSSLAKTKAKIAVMLLGLKVGIVVVPILLIALCIVGAVMQSVDNSVASTTNAISAIVFEDKTQIAYSTLSKDSMVAVKEAWYFKHIKPCAVSSINFEISSKCEITVFEVSKTKNEKDETVFTNREIAKIEAEGFVEIAFEGVLLDVAMGEAEYFGNFIAVQIKNSENKEIKVSSLFLELEVLEIDENVICYSQIMNAENKQVKISSLFLELEVLEINENVICCSQIINAENRQIRISSLFLQQQILEIDKNILRR